MVRPFLTSSHLGVTTLAVFALCSGACAPGPAGQDSGEGMVDCDVTIDETWPAQGATDAYWRDAVEFRLSGPDSTALVVADFDGAQSWEDDGTSLVYTPDAPLEPSSSYTVGLDYCHGSPSITFETSSYGLPIEDPEALPGQAYLVDLTAGRFVTGGSMAEGLSMFFTRSILFEVLSVGHDELSIRAGVSTARGEAQDPCYLSVDIDEVDGEEAPYFELSIEDFTFGAYRGELRMYEFTMRGTIAPDGSSVGGVSYEVTVLAEELAGILGVEPDRICDLLDDLGASCEPCPGSADESCVTVGADRIEAPRLDAGIERVTELSAACEEEAS